MSGASFKPVAGKAWVSVGLDISTYTGMALVGHPNLEDRGKVVNFEHERGMCRLQLIAREVERSLQIWQPNLVIIERYAYVKNKDSFALMVACATVIKLVLYKLQLPWMEVTPKTLKLWTTGKGNAKKPQMAFCIKERWGFVTPSDDIADAYALAKMGQLEKSLLLSIAGVSMGI